ncbi:EEF1A lysine methyltransferase 2 [Tribolium castaneum]|uniref:Protein-lysine N-methyltransferase TcasGA2_TC003501 n=1 Tax=Tribolium castaneum TaxID=7070 RepID=D6WH31_TRICA|nr:PREDICTED: protein-lysine N-methyltransferase mettl10 [Tribolium castaneum]XP_008190968.1 PREDICTED: protein-lysine N-methyltransferase mettl10 [Tribolium castaneum]XP_015833322.1 PREDICTED: protein-lysine N-methyltransferase mettl10 [Tribolium castaneum]XP_974902.1 PREDICTED: protein-lysine N-methyltransferase mettl10 [Tribolium castaneum]EFA00625.1 Methyltransferase-like protein 10 [Tribolium castaneum]|eukprot:XP_008190967.1 PREDICTED: protein-lysine N-methyltransferase mettl10 [Tribolium castaneum]
MEELQESELGSQEYWDNRYKEEIENFQDHGDPGEIWFGEDTVERLIKWIEKNETATKESKILDVGCGNGMFLIELATEGYTNLFGVDYSKDAITLAKSIAQKQGFEIQYSECDILEHLDGQFDIIHDKGTYDAISLNANIKEFRGKYLENVHKALDPNGFFIITTCNWTKDELNEHFRNHFVCVDNIPTPQFQFGGKTGNTVTSLVYRKI